MNTESTFQFKQLKKAVVSKFLDKHSAAPNVKDWNGETIALFQEDLSAEVNTKVSEKWFYTYFKNDTSKLPRIDMLNLLSAYVGYENWHAFKQEHPIDKKRNNIKKLSWLLVFMPIAVVFIVTMNSENEFRFCFHDDLNVTIASQLDIKILEQNQSPLYFKTDSLGCFEYKTKQDLIKFEISSPYYKTDTIVRSIDNKDYHSIQLKSDDYAFILKYYTSGNVKDWSKHKQKIENLIQDNAQIYRRYHNNIGVEIYTKDEFVRLLTIPTSALNRIRILDKNFNEDTNQIATLEFIID